MSPFLRFVCRFASLFALLASLASPAAPQMELARAQIAEPLDETKRSVLIGNIHPLARAEFDRGEAPPDLPMERMLLLLKRSPEQEAALEDFLAQQLDPSSENFHQWLTPQQFGERFGARNEDVRQIASWLRRHGFQVARVSNGCTVIEFSGTAGQVNETFHTPIHQYVVEGETHWANAADPSIPSALAPVVAGVVSLHSFPPSLPLRVLREPTNSRTAAGKPIVTPEFTFGGSLCGRQGNQCYALGPADLATIYNIAPLWNSGIDGTGQTIAIVAASNIVLQDVRDFRTLFGLPASDPVVILNGPDPGLVQSKDQPVETEADADLDWTGAVAKNATLYLVVSKTTNSTFGMDLSAEYIVDRNLAPILSASYAVCEQGLGSTGKQFYNQLWQQAAAQGISVLVATGDNGSAGCDSFRGNAPAPAKAGLQVSAVASTQYDTAVGGTDFNDIGNQAAFWNATNDPVTQGSAKSYIPEMVWDDTCTNSVFGSSTDPETNCNDPTLSSLVLVGGASGGSSTVYGKPSWQAGAGVPNDGRRDLPDLSVFAAGGAASGSFYVVCESDFDQDKSGARCDLTSPFMHFVPAGGTSISAQVFAGMMALVNQKTNSRQGNVNPALYGIAAQQSVANCNSSSPAANCVFNDVTVGTNSMPCTEGSPNCSLANPAHTYGVLSGYNASPGFDLATGLGSVNVTNLANGGGWAVNTAPDFALSSPNAMVTVASPGSSGSLTLTISSVNGFSGTVNLGAAACSGLPVGASCSFSAPSVTVNQANPSASVTMTVTTHAASVSVPVSEVSRQRPWNVPTAALLSILCFGIFLLRVQRNARRLRTFAALLVFALMDAAGCGGGGSSGGGGGGGTPVGTTNPVITMTNGSISHSLVFTLTVE